MKDKNIIEQRINNSDDIEISEDFILPEYYEDMVRVLDVKASARINGKYIGTKNIDADGEVIYNVLFMNSDGKIKSAFFSSPVSKSFEMYGTSDAADPWLSLKVVSVNYRMLSPRKINLKSRAVCDISYTSAGDCDITVNGKTATSGDDTVEKLIDEISCISFFFFEDNGIEFSESFELDSGKLPSDVICSELSADVSECRILGGKAYIKCNMFFRGLFEHESGECFTVTRHFQIEHEMDTPDLADNVCCFPSVEIKEQGAGIADGSGTVSDSVEAEFICDFKLLAATDSKSEICVDGFSTEYGETLKFEEREIVRSAAARRVSFTKNISREASSSGINGDIVYTGARIFPDKTEYDSKNKKNVFSGSCVIKIIYKDEYGAYNFAELKEPYNFETDSEDCGNVHSYISDCTIPSFEMRHDGENLYFECEIVFSFMELCTEKIRILKEIEINTDMPAETQERHGIRIYYPYKKEKIWDVAKKYRLTEKELKYANRLTEDSRFCEGRVLIPEHRKGKDCIYGKLI